MSIAEKLTTVYNNVPKVYEAGEKAENGRMWDYIQNYGNRTTTGSMFNSWNCEYIRPKYKVVPTVSSSRNQTFSSNPSLKRIEKEYFDFSQCPRSTVNTSGCYYTFTSCFALEVIEDVGLCNVGYFTHTFNWCGKLHTIECIYPDKDTKFDSAFNNCKALTHIRVDGVIGKNINFKDCPLDVESALSVMRALRNFSADFVYKYSDPDNPESNITEIWLDEDGDGEGDIYVQNVTDVTMYYTFPTIYFSEATIALLDSADFSTYPEEELPFNANDGWRVGIEVKMWNIG